MSLNNAHEGYDYQDLVTSYFILKEILNGNLDSRFSIDRKNTENDIPDRFDDLVIINEENIQRKQIKYSNEQTSTRLTKDYLSGDSHYKLAIHKLYESWKALKTNNTEFRLCLAWDEPTEDSIVRVLDLQPQELSSFSSLSSKVFKINLDKIWEIDPENFNRWNSLQKYVSNNNVDRKDFNDFCDDLLIEVNLPKASLNFHNPNELEKTLIYQAEQLGIEQYPNDDIYVNDFLQRLVKLVGNYRTRSSIVSVQEILTELRIKTDFGEIKQKFEINQSKNITSDNNYRSFYNIAVTNKKTILIGEPGSGKSWFLTNFIDYLERNNKSVLRHYCFTSTEDEFSEKRVSSDVFFGNLISGIGKIYPELTKIKKQFFAANLDELNMLLMEINEPLVIVVDGLDHINRVQISSSILSKEKTKILDFISQITIPENITIILGSQSVDELDFLKNKFEYIEEQLPTWTIDNTRKLFTKYNHEDVQIDNTSIIYSLHDKSEGNPLYLTYLLLTLSSHEKITKELIESLPKYDFNLKNYYDYLTSQINDNVTSEILSCLDFPVNRKELQDIIPIKHHFKSNMKVLSPVITENTSRGGIKLYHDSFRRYNIEKLSGSADLNDIYSYIVDWLMLSDFYESDKSYRYLFSYLIRMGKHDEVIHFAEDNFLSNSLYYAHSEYLIKNNYKNFLHVARETQDWSLFIYAGELKRAIDTTSSEEYHNQFIDNFELYFESVCLIYGANKANNLLYFNDKKNHSDIVTAQAFRILERHNFSPRWVDISDLFNGRITLEHFKYYISYLAQDLKKLSNCFTKIVSENRWDFLKILVEEVYELKGFDCIVDLYNKLNSDEKYSTTRLINNALEGTSCNQRIPIVEKHEHSDLLPLSLDFMSNTGSHEKLNELYFQLGEYASTDIRKLIDFEKSINVNSFAHKWIKFAIRNFIIEANVDTKTIEERMVDNIIFLANDTFPNDYTNKYSSFIYQNRDIIDISLRKTFIYITSGESWEKIFSFRAYIPCPIMPIIEKQFLSPENINHIIKAYDDFDIQGDDTYSEHAEYAFKKSIYYAKVKKFDEAKEELKKAIHLTTGYTFRKDRNLAEIIDPLLSVNKVSPEFAQKYTKKLKNLTDAVMMHTEDGKDTRWLTIEWFEAFLKIDYSLASKYLINELLKDGTFWKLEYMFVDLLLHSNRVSPTILNFLYKLSPTNTKDSYLNGFLDVIDRLVDKDRKLAELSMRNLSIRDWNNSYDTLKDQTLKKYQNTSENLGIILPVKCTTVNNSTLSNSLNKEKLSDTLTKQLCIGESLACKSLVDLIEFFDKKENFEVKDFNFINFLLKDQHNKISIDSILIPIIKKRFTIGCDHFINLRHLIVNSDASKHQKISLLINNFVYSKDGWYSSFIEKESLRLAVEINKDESLIILANTLSSYYEKAQFMSKSTANLIIAFEYANLDKNHILSMYKRGFYFIKNRLPYKKDFNWGSLNYLEDNELNEDEIAIILLLSKTSSFDSSIQKEVILALSYIIKNDAQLLERPLRWFFKNLNLFHEITIASILELLSIESSNILTILINIKLSIESARTINNLYIQNTIDDILLELENE